MKHKAESYRPEIDGLRAIAVLSVILFHAEFHLFSGGYVGVDIFFVISGYLITRIIHKEIQNNSFSLTTFYERRARRILPALFFVVAATVPFSYLWMLPSEIKDFGQSLIASNLFVSNILFWLESGYFETQSELKPLLHTWTLSIEEQYYVFYPLLLLALSKSSHKRIIVVISTIALISLIAAEYSSQRYISANFYLIHTRAWELAIGALAALYLSNHEFNKKYENAVGISGIFLILIAVFSFDSSTPFPSLYTILPVAGAAAIIISTTHNSLIGKILSYKPLVFIGLISYSLYLWHHPIFALSRMRKMGELSANDYLSLIALCFILAYLSYKFVETPFRNKDKISRKFIFSLSLAGICFFLVLGGGIYINEQNKVTKETAPSDCHWIDSSAQVNCYSKTISHNKKIVLWGDSFSDVISESVGNQAEEKGYHFLPIISNSCPSLIGTERNEDETLGLGFGDRCLNHVNTSMQIIKEYAPNIVIIANNFLWYANTINLENSRPILIEKNNTQATGTDTVTNSLVKTVSYLNEIGAQVIIISTHPQLKDYQTKVRQFKTGANNEKALSLDPAKSLELNNKLEIALSKTGIPYKIINPHPIFCNKDLCSAITKSEELLLYDNSHLTSRAAQRLAKEIATHF